MEKCYTRLSGGRYHCTELNWRSPRWSFLSYVTEKFLNEWKQWNLNGNEVVCGGLFFVLNPKKFKVFMRVLQTIDVGTFSVRLYMCSLQMWRKGSSPR